MTKGNDELVPRWRTRVASNRVATLEQDLRSGATTPEAFWAESERTGTPIVETLPGDPDAICVTFIHRADPASGPWALSDGISPASSAEFQLTNIDDTDIWHISLRVPAGTQVTYTFTQDVDLPSRLKTPGFDVARHVAERKVDPYNTDVVVFPERELPGPSPWGRTVSLVKRPPAQTWTVPSGDAGGKGTTTVHDIPSDALGRTVRVYVHAAPGNGPATAMPLVVAFDGWEFVEVGSVATVFDNLVASGKVPPFVAVMPDSAEHRPRDLAYSDDYAVFVTDELLTWAQAELGLALSPATNVIAGASLGGLTAFYVALRRPDLFPNVISLIGALRMSRGGERDWLLHAYSRSPRLPLTVYMEAGLLDGDVFPFGNIPPMLDANREFLEILREKDYDVSYREFPGGHDWVWLPETLARGLIHLLGRMKVS